MLVENFVQYDVLENLQLQITLTSTTFIGLLCCEFSVKTDVLHEVKCSFLNYSPAISLILSSRDVTYSECDTLRNSNLSDPIVLDSNIFVSDQLFDYFRK